jgi:hypothetical protein
LTFFGHFLPKIGENFNQFSGHTVAVANGFAKYFANALEPLEIVQALCLFDTLYREVLQKGKAQYS